MASKKTKLPTFHTDQEERNFWSRHSVEEFAEGLRDLDVMIQPTRINDIDRVHEFEEANYQTARKALGDTVYLAEELVDLYNLLSHMIKDSGVGPRDEIIAASQFLLACRYQLVMGALTLLRGHLSDSHYYTRKAIEFCAFAARVKEHPHLAMVWLEAAKDEASYEKYREKFGPSKLFPDDHAILGKLWDRYDICSKHSHPSLYSIARHVETERTATDFQIRFNYFELKSDDYSEPARTFLWTVDTHFGILRVFEEVLADVIAHDRKKWEIRQNAVGGKLAVHKERWKSVILS